MLVAVAVLASLGVLSIWADSRADGVKQLIFLGVGVGCMTAFQAVNYQKIGRFAWILFAGSLLLILYTVAATDSTLTLRTRMGEPKTVRPAYADAFVGDYLLQFTRDAKGNVNGMLMSSGRVRRVQFVRR